MILQKLYLNKKKFELESGTAIASGLPITLVRQNELDLITTLNTKASAGVVDDSERVISASDLNGVGAKITMKYAVLVDDDPVLQFA